ncbi:MAG: LamG domain-containing protein [Saprospiraceae bacterium]|nr:LamG domain-containing protein [Lewinella sp.]
MKRLLIILTCLAAIALIWYNHISDHDGLTPFNQRGITTSPSLVSSGLHFDGINDYVEIPDNDLLAFSNELSFECWIKPEATDHNHIVTKQYCANHQYSFSLFLHNGKLKFAFDEDGICNAATSPVSIYSMDEGAVKTGVWQHVALTYSTAGAHFYVNGKECPGTLTGNYTSIYNSISPLRIGGYQLGTAELTNFYQGMMCEFRSWNYARSREEIQAQMFTRLEGNESGLVLYYAFDGGMVDSDNTNAFNLSDKTANHLNGRLQNFSLRDKRSNWTGSIVDEFDNLKKPGN